MKISFIIILISISNFTILYSKAGYFEIDTLRAEEYFVFPIIKSSSDTFTIRSINQHLQLSELELLNGYQKDNIFEKTSLNNGTIYGGKVDISFYILANNKQILSIKFNEYSCGATCQYWVKYYNFNSQNGDLIQLKDYFTQQGFEIFNQKIIEKRKKNFKKQLLNLDSNEREYYLNVLGCFEYDDLYDYYIKDSNIFIDGENCLSKNQKFDDLDMISSFSLSEFSNFLNSCGKTIFGLNNDSLDLFYSNELPQIFDGFIGESTPIIFIMKNRYDNEITGIYAYLKYGIGIYMDGEIESNVLNLIEYNDDFDENGYINAIYKDDEIIGKWMNRDKSKSFELYLKRRKRN